MKFLFNILLFLIFFSAIGQERNFDSLFVVSESFDELGNKKIHYLDEPDSTEIIRIYSKLGNKVLAEKTAIWQPKDSLYLLTENKSFWGGRITTSHQYKWRYIWFVYFNSMFDFWGYNFYPKFRLDDKLHTGKIEGVRYFIEYKKSKFKYRNNLLKINYNLDDQD